MDIATWLRDLGLERYEPAFRDNEIDLDVLSELTEAHLLALGSAFPGRAVSADGDVLRSDGLDGAVGADHRCVAGVIERCRLSGALTMSRVVVDCERDARAS
jgi:hypothetical protein